MQGYTIPANCPSLCPACGGTIPASPSALFVPPGSKHLCDRCHPWRGTPPTYRKVLDWAKATPPQDHTPFPIPTDVQELADTFVPGAAFSGILPGQVWEHKVRKTQYVVERFAIFQYAGDTLLAPLGPANPTGTRLDGAVVVIYYALPPERAWRWVRPVGEFLERFTLVQGTP